jgi:hypothetical protein
MMHPYVQYALIRQRVPDPERESERRRLRDTSARPRPPLRQRLGTTLVHLGARVAGDGQAPARLPHTGRPSVS